jgi:hypothetical protein
MEKKRVVRWYRMIAILSILFFFIGFVVGWYIGDYRWKGLYRELREEKRNIFKKLGCKVKETKMKVEELQKENKWLLFIITTFSKLLNDGKVAARKEIEPLLVVWGKKYSVVANEDWEWEVRKTESVKKPVYDIIEIDLRNVLKG